MAYSSQSSQSNSLRPADGSAEDALISPARSRSLSGPPPPTAHVMFHEPTFAAEGKLDIMMQLMTIARGLGAVVLDFELVTDDAHWAYPNGLLIFGIDQDFLPYRTTRYKGQQDGPCRDLDGLTGLFGHTEKPDGMHTRRHPLGFRLADRQWLKEQEGTLEGKIPPINFLVFEHEDEDDFPWEAVYDLPPTPPSSSHNPRERLDTPSEGDVSTAPSRSPSPDPAQPDQAVKKRRRRRTRRGRRGRKNKGAPAGEGEVKADDTGSDGEVGQGGPSKRARRSPAAEAPGEPESDAEEHERRVRDVSVALSDVSIGEIANMDAEQLIALHPDVATWAGVQQIDDADVAAFLAHVENFQTWGPEAGLGPAGDEMPVLRYVTPQGRVGGRREFMFRIDTPSGWPHPDELWRRYRPLFLHYVPTLQLLDWQRWWWTPAAYDRLIGKR